MEFSLKDNRVKLPIHEEAEDEFVMDGKVKNETKGFLCCVEGVVIVLPRFYLGKSLSKDNPQLDEDLGDNGSKSASNGVKSINARGPVVLGRLTKGPIPPPPPPNPGQDPQHN